MRGGALGSCHRAKPAPPPGDQAPHSVLLRTWIKLAKQRLPAAKQVFPGRRHQDLRRRPHPTPAPHRQEERARGREAAIGKDWPCPAAREEEKSQQRGCLPGQSFASPSAKRQPKGRPTQLIPQESRQAGWAWNGNQLGRLTLGERVGVAIYLEAG